MTDQIGEYQVVDTLGEGSFGELLLAQAPSGERVVIKCLKVDMLVDDKALDLFQREAGVLRSLRHPAVPRFIDAGVDEEGIPYLVQQHVPGDTLEKAVHEGLRFDSVAAEALARKLLEALRYLHGLHPPVIHRDLKPANIILSNGSPVIVDFGAVCGKAMLKGEASETVVGTFGYMAPEMLKGHSSPASDLYSLGATLLFAFSGREPETFPTERLRLRFRDALALPKPLDRLLEALLEPAAEDRPQSAEEALALLGGWVSSPDDAPLIRHPASGKLTERKRKPRSLLLKSLGIGSVAGLAVLLVVYGPAAVFGMIKSAAIGVLVIVLVILLFVTFAGGC